MVRRAACLTEVSPTDKSGGTRPAERLVREPQSLCIVYASGGFARAYFNICVVMLRQQYRVTGCVMFREFSVFSAQFAELLDRSVGERGLEKDLDLQTAVTLALFQAPNSRRGAAELQLLWTCDAIACDAVHWSWCGRLQRCTRALVGLVLYPGAVCVLVSSRWKKGCANFWKWQVTYHQPWPRGSMRMQSGSTVGAILAMAICQRQS